VAPEREIFSQGQENCSCLVHHGSRVGGDELTGPDVHWSLHTHHTTAAMQAILNVHPPDTLSLPRAKYIHWGTAERHLMNVGAYFAAIVVKRAFLSAAWPSPEPKWYMCVDQQHLGYKWVGYRKAKIKFRMLWQAMIWLTGDQSQALTCSTFRFIITSRKSYLLPSRARVSTDHPELMQRSSYTSTCQDQNGADSENFLMTIGNHIKQMACLANPGPSSGSRDETDSSGSTNGSLRENSVLDDT
jgi:hypothetical protein